MSGLCLPEMTEDEILQSCKEHDGYVTPELNDVLYLHFKGYREIKGLEKFTAVKALYLESNGLTEVSSVLRLWCFMTY
jgi:dynein assembly factor 1, axonemal